MLVKRAGQKATALTLFLLCTLSFSSRAEVLVGEVIRLSDGDTITVLDSTHTQHKVRLAGIDAPESHQAFGNVSKQHLASLVFRKHVTVGWIKRDRYGRIVGKVYADGVDLCLEQVKAGLAWWYEKYQKEQIPEDRETYRHAEAEARARRAGLWSDADPKPPWDYRRERRAASR
jgi:endonuclease YncB( thermonuclease family)